MRHNYIPGLDGLRALSVLLVILAHAGIEKVPGSLGVTVFFFISGFLITGLLLQERERTGTVSILGFYGRRYQRLMPELTVYVAVATVASALWFNPYRWVDVGASLFYLTNYLKVFSPAVGDAPFPMSHFWSLAVEEHFYLTWPLLMLAFAKPRAALGVTCLVLVGALVARRVAVGLHAPVEYARYASECRIDSIAYGGLLALLHHQRSALLARIAGLGHWPLLVGSGLVLASTFGGALGLPDAAHETLVYCGQGVGLLLCFAYLYVGSRGGWAIRLLELPALRFVGRASYGVYIWHYAAVFLAAMALGASDPLDLSTGGRIMVALMATSLSVLLGWISLRFVLTPVRSLGRGAVALPERKAA